MLPVCKICAQKRELFAAAAAPHSAGGRTAGGSPGLKNELKYRVTICKG